MAGNAWKWFLGCGIGCAIVLVILGALAAGSFFFVRDVVGEVQKTQRGMDAVTEQFGRTSEFRPDPDGAIRPERLELFLAVRGSLSETRAELERTLTLLQKEAAPDQDEGRGGMLGKFRAGLGVLPQLIGFYNARSDALLEHGMGLGEYTYIYVLAYYSWLGRSPADGPPFRLVGDSREVRGWDEERWGNADEFDVREDRTERILRTLSRQLLPMLRNQLADLDDAGPWREALEAEIAAMEIDSLRLPWADGVPEAVERSLDAFRDRLEQSYSEQCNALEFGMGHD